MQQTKKSRKRPCRICRRWFIPNPRVGDRQKTCGAPECKRRWHIKKCAVWNQKNKEYFKSNYLNKKLTAAGVAGKAEKSTHAVRSPGIPPPPRLNLRLPRQEVQEVIGAQHLVIIEYIVQLLFRRVQEVIP